MKKLLPSIWLACFLLIGMTAQAYEFTINGQISLNGISSEPIPFALIEAISDTGEAQAIEADENGSYSLTFEIPDGTVSTITVSTIDWCTGDILETIITTDVNPATVDFSICNDFDFCGAWFDYYPDSDDPLSINFLNAAWGENINSYAWDFGDGNTSTEENPTHVYAEAGAYEVVLSISADDCETTEGYTIYVGENNGNPCGCDDGGEPVCIDFGLGFPIPFPNACLAICEGFSEADFVNCDFEPTDCWASFYYYQDDFGSLAVNFIDDSFGEDITSWLWDFGDGATSTEQNPVHEYAVGGNFDVTLTIAGDSCESTIVHHICVFDWQPVDCEASFGYTLDGSLTVAFYDYSWGENITAWSWDFGDGNTSNEQFPLNTYAEQGEYLVTLTIESDSCTSTFVQPIWLFNGGGGGNECDAFFYYYELGGGSFQFEDWTWSTSVNTWSWDFGDGNTSNEQNPMHTYTEDGDYIVTLTIESDSCTSTFEMPVWVWIGCGCDLTIYDPVCVIDPTTGLTFTYSTPCDAECAGFTPDQFVECNSGVDCEAFFFWVEEGENTIAFIPFSQGNGVTFYWDFGDGNTSTEQSPIHTYAEGGIYTVSLLVSSEDCTVTYASDVFINNCTCDDIYDPVCVYDPNFGFELWFSNACEAECVGYTPDQFVDCDGGGNPFDCWASFDYYPVDSLTVQFEDFSFENVTSWAWDFGDGNTSTEQSPLHTYAEGGIYEVLLTIETADGCTSEVIYHICLGDEVIDFEFPECQAFFFFTQSGDDMLDFQFADFSYGAITSWTWDFGDGTISTEQNPEHTYAEPGLYTVSLTIAAEDCESNFTVDVMTDYDLWYNGACTALFMPLIGEENNVTFLNLSSGDAVAFEWDFGDGNTSTEQFPEHTYAESGTYDVTLTMTSLDGCTNSMVMTVNLGESWFGGVAQSAVATNTNEIENVQVLKLYPNPVVDELTIALTAKESGIYEMELVNLAGQRLQSKISNITIGDNTLDMDVSELPAGVYFIRLNNATESVSLKFVK